MLKKRIIACLVVREGLVVQSMGFKRYLPVGKPRIAVEFLNNWGIDEIIIVDILAGSQNKDPDYSMIKNLSEKCHVPLTVGGGIRSTEQIHKLMDCGADKIAINHGAISRPQLIEDAARIFGSQCIVVSVDAVQNNGSHQVYDTIHRAPLNLDVADWCMQAERMGAGEIFLTSVDRDGSCEGFDVDLYRQVPTKLKIPVIASGGAGNAMHFKDVFTKTSVSAASAANFFHFSEHAVTKVKSYLEKDLDIRLDTPADYKDFLIDEKNRIGKREDQYLEDLLYVRIEKEII